MLFIVTFLSVIAVGSLIWTIIQIFKPELFYNAENEANLKKERPWWYLVLSLIGLICIIVLWIQALQLNKITVWVLTVFFTLGAIKGIGIVFFYDKFSTGVTNYIGHIKNNKNAYVKLVVGRAILTIVATLSALYFAGVFGNIA